MEESIPDDASVEVQVNPPALPGTPEQVDLRHLLPAIKDQGARGTCLAFAVTAAHEVARLVNTSTIEDLSEEALYWCCKQVDDNTLSGTTFYSAATALRKWGQPPEEIWPYDDNRDETSPTYVSPPGALDPQFCHIASLDKTEVDVESIKSHLASGDAVALGILLAETFFTPVDGHIAMPQPGADLLGGHAILIVGYIDSHAGVDSAYFIVRNSWGADWGDNGYGYLPLEYIERYGREAWVLTSISSAATL